MPSLLLGPLLRYVGRTEATVWVEADRACEVEVLGQAHAHVRGARSSLCPVLLEDLPQASVIAYGVTLDGVRGVAGGRRRPAAAASTIHTRHGEHQARLVFGSCRVGLPSASHIRCRRVITRTAMAWMRCGHTRGGCKRGSSRGPTRCC